LDLFAKKTIPRFLANIEIPNDKPTNQPTPRKMFLQQNLILGQIFRNALRVTHAIIAASYSEAN
jgi:hypothetical protein